MRTKFIWQFLMLITSLKISAQCVDVALVTTDPPMFNSFGSVFNPDDDQQSDKSNLLNIAPFRIGVGILDLSNANVPNGTLIPIRIEDDFGVVLAEVKFVVGQNPTTPAGYIDDIDGKWASNFLPYVNFSNVWTPELLALGLGLVGIEKSPWAAAHGYTYPNATKMNWVIDNNTVLSFERIQGIIHSGYSTTTAGIQTFTQTINGLNGSLTQLTNGDFITSFNLANHFPYLETSIPTQPLTYSIGHTSSLPDTRTMNISNGSSTDSRFGSASPGGNTNYFNFLSLPTFGETDLINYEILVGTTKVIESSIEYRIDFLF